MTPRFSILTPVYDPPADVLEACVASVRAQTWADWELLLVDDCSPAPHIAPQLAAMALGDARIRVVARTVNGGIVAASNDALAAATGEFVVLLDHDDLLTSDALASLAEGIDGDPAGDLLYTDEDKISETGERYDAFYKPDWSPARLATNMYVGHLLCMRRTLVVEVGGFRHGYEGSQDHDLTLRVSECARSVVHVRGIRYHWRASATSTAAASAAKPYAVEAGRQAVADHFARLGIEAEVEPVRGVSIFKTKRRIDPEPLVSIVIPSRGSAALVDGRFRTLVTGAVRSIVRRSTYTNYEVVAVLDRLTPPYVVRELGALLGDRLRLVWFDRPFNFSDKVNVGVLSAQGEYVLLLNDDTEVITPDWIEYMLGPALDPAVGMVGAKLYFADGRVQHAGHVYSSFGAYHVGLGAAHDDPGYLGAYLLERECSGVTAACALIPRELFLQVGGFTLTLPNNFNDVDFSMKITSAGRRIVWTPHAELFHYESLTRVNTVQRFEHDTMRRRWSERMRFDRYWWAPGMPAPGAEPFAYDAL